jgi:hypothetical protein
MTAGADYSGTAARRDLGAASVRDAFAQYPSGVVALITVMPGSHGRRSRRWAERRYLHLVHFSEPDQGGHFAFLEQPEHLVDDVRTTFRHL